MTETTQPGMQISCKELVEVVTDYLEGSLDDTLVAEIEAHLELCPGCDAYLQQMRTTIDELGHVPVDSLSEHAKAGLMAAFRNFRPPRSTDT